MDNVIPMKPKQLHFPTDRPFQINDQYNGKFRGTWWYSIGTRLIGPFGSLLDAATTQQRTQGAPSLG